ncbi:MAG: penicillin-binding protein 2, partial [Myxococcales bacterium]|nr:penicillin-binding protein 2 [Myxococcales bacterium]
MIDLIAPTTTSGRVEYKTSYRWVLIIVTLFFLVLFYRFFWLQVIKGREFQTLATISYIGHYELPAPRGQLIDRNGVKMAVNDFRYSLIVFPRRFYLRGGRVHFDELSKLLQWTEQQRIEYEDKILRALKERRRRPLELLRELPQEKVDLLNAELFRFPGLFIQTKPMRLYPLKALASHLLGYVNHVNRDDLLRWPDQYGPYDLIGRTGLERRFEELLRGEKGEELFIKTAGGRRVSSAEIGALLPKLESKPSVPGNTLGLTIDVRVQTIVERAFGGSWRRSGTGVVLEVKTGRVIALYSKPDFDPNHWAGRMSKDLFERYSTNKFSPMLNKGLRGFAPGSVYKIVTAIAGLSEGVITPETKIHCAGVYEFAKRPFRCHHRAGHGDMNLADAMKVSCDVYFYRVAEQLGMDKLAKYGRLFGFGQKTGFDLDESPGRVPTMAWYEKRGNWQPGFTLSTGVGQADVLVTPLQVALAYAALANGGTVYRPYLVEQYRDPRGDLVKLVHPQPRWALPFRSEYMKIVRDSLVRVVNDEHGSAYTARLDGLTYAGKTGTAEAKERRRGSEDDKHFKQWLLQDHAWFVGYAPATDPEIVVVVLLEHGGSGGREAAPIVQRIIRDYFNLK